MSTRHQERRRTVAFLVFCVCAYLLCAPGRIVFPDDEIVFQTSASLYERGELAIDGIARRTGEPKGRPSGTFGWAEGPEKKRYGFFGHALSVVALPMYGAGTVAAQAAPPVWKHAIRSDHFFLQRRSQAGDWTRLIVSLTNCLLTPLAAWLLMVWARALGFRPGTALLLGAAYAFGTLAWPTTRTFLSEPLSTVILLGAVLAVQRCAAAATSRWHAARWWLWSAAALTGLSVHAHLLNLIAVPCIAAYAWAGLRQRSAQTGFRRDIAIAIALGACGLALLGYTQWLRFGSPFESGRYGLYSHFEFPTASLLALIASPGRSLWLTSPILVGAALGVAALHRRVPHALWLCVALVATRLLFVATRSDWWGGWAIGPRFLLPVLPFAVLPLAALWEAARPRVRNALAALLAGSIALQAHLSLYSIFEWMLLLHKESPKDPGYLWRSHWTLEGSPAAGFLRLEPDLLVRGSWRLAERGYPGFAAVFAVVLLVAVSSLAVLVWSSVRSGLRPEAPLGDSPRDVFEQGRQDHAPR